MNPISTILPAIAGCLFFLSCNNTPSYQLPNATSINASAGDSIVGPRIKTAAELRWELAQSEAAAPADMLSVTGTMKENKVLIQKPNFFRHSKYATDGYLINGVIRSKATIASFKDAVVRITFLTETNTPLTMKDFSVYKFFQPSEITPFELKVYPPESAKNIDLQIVNATSLLKNL